MKYLVFIFLAGCGAAQLNPLTEAEIAARDMAQARCLSLDTAEARQACVDQIRASSDARLCARYPQSKVFCHPGG